MASSSTTAGSGMPKPEDTTGWRLLGPWSRIRDISTYTSREPCGTCGGDSNGWRCWSKPGGPNSEVGHKHEYFCDACVAKDPIHQMHSLDTLVNGR